MVVNSLFAVLVSQLFHIFASHLLQRAEKGEKDGKFYERKGTEWGGESNPPRRSCWLGAQVERAP